MITWGWLVAGAQFASASDCNGNGTPDVQDLAVGSSPDCNTNLVPDECEQALVRLGLRAGPIGISGQLGTVTTADMDRDGTPDIVVTTEARIGVFFNRGDRTFEDARYTNLFGPALTLAAADFDEDGLGDLVIAAGRSNLSLYWGDAETGFRHETLQVEVEGVEAGVHLPMAAELDGKAPADLVLLHSEAGSISILLGEPNRTFRLSGTYLVGVRPSGVAATDLNGDGATDLMVTNRQAGTLSVLVGDGQGGFAPRPEIPAGGTEPRRPVRGDFNADTIEDVAHLVDGAIAIHLGDGTGAFETRVSFVLDENAAALVAGDVDTDGDDDIVVGYADRSSLSVLVQHEGRIAKHSDLLTGVPSTQLAVAEFDADGQPDLLAGSCTADSLRLFWQGEEGSLIPLVAERYPYQGVPHNIAAGDMDQDGDFDLLTANGSRGNVTVFSNDGRGVFQAVQTTTDVGTHFNSIAVGDLDNDGDLDAVTADLDSVDSGVHVFLNRGDATLGVPSRYQGGNAAYYVTTVDLDGDGHRDIFTTNLAEKATSWVLLNDGDGTFVDGIEYSIGSSSGAATGDFDLDGDVDVAIADVPPGRITILENRGDGSFDLTPPLAAGLSPTFIVGVDVDRDGDVDLAASGVSRSGSVSILRNPGDGLFEEPALYPVGRSPWSLGSADMDGDGFADLLTVNRDNDSISLLLNSRDGEFFRGGETAVAGREPRFLAVADLNGDGAPDVATGDHSTGSVSVLLNGRPARFSAAYRSRICTVQDFVDVSTASRVSNTERTAKYVLPARPDPELLPVLFQNTTRFPLHQDFLTSVFPDPNFANQFQFVGGEDYDRLVGRRGTRAYFVGSVSRRRLDEGVVYAFTVFADVGFSADETLQVEEVAQAFQTLQREFELDPLVYLPDSGQARESARNWKKPPFPVLFEDELSDTPAAGAYEPYTLGVGYGRVRLYDEEAFNAASARGQLSFQEILVLDFTPRDIEGVVGGVVTARVQGELSHWSIRAARRGTPNAFLSSAETALGPLEGELVRLEVTTNELVVEPTTLEDAEAFWAAARPSLGDLPEFDAQYAALDSLLEIDLTIPSPEGRFGGKATHLARLQQLLRGGPFDRFVARGFGIPFRYSSEFFEANTIQSVLNPGRTVTYAAYLRELSTWDDFLSDASLRFETLKSFRSFVEEHGVVSGDLVRHLADRIQEVFGSTESRVRFRSSSNVEDLLEFNGAGLYDSTSVCVADDLDGDDRGPSACDPQRNDERGIARGLKRVWASLWSFRAFEERAFFQIAQENAAMGVLVTRAFPDEEANGVAFTGNPRDGLDQRYLVTVQAGEASVVSPEPGEVPERNLVGILDGRAVTIDRVLRSTLVPAGDLVLSDERLIELSELMAYVDRNLVLPLEGHPREQILLDFEFKLDDGTLAIKQVRPFLLSDAPPPTPTFTIEFPAGLSSCGVFPVERPGRSPRREYETRANVVFSGESHTISTDRSLAAGRLVEGLRYGPDRELAEPNGPGFFQISRLGAAGEEVTRYDLRYTQRFFLRDRRECTLEISEGIEFTAQGATPLGTPLVLDEAWLEEPGTRMELLVDGATTTRFASCVREELPLSTIDVTLADGSFVRLTERSRPATSGEDTAPASLVGAEVELHGRHQSVTDYWRLVYAARRHNRDIVYWVVLEPSITVPGLGQAVRVIEVSAPAFGPDDRPTLAASVRLLDRDFNTLSSPEVSNFERRAGGQSHSQAPFQRGDANADGRRNTADALEVLEAIFRRATVSCRSAADANDDGRINVIDPVLILRHVFGLEDLQRAPLSCGVDPTPDRLACGESVSCRDG